MIYKHKKTGNLYELKDVAVNATNGVDDGKNMAYYVKKDHPLMSFVRELTEFQEKFEPLEK